jgi:lactate racemase
VIASCGGSPSDLNMIQAHKTLEMASHACEDGGDIILLAECADGLGRSDFRKWFTATDSVDLSARLRTEYQVNGQTAWALMTKGERFRIHLVSSLPDGDVREMRMLPAGTLNEAMNKVSSQHTGYVMPRGAAFLPKLIASNAVTN